MKRYPLPPSPLADVETIALTPDHAPLLQTFFDAYPAYFLGTTGETAGPGEAVEEITGMVPSDMSHSDKLVVGYVGATGALVAMSTLITDMPVPSIFHIGTFILATDRHGSGDAQVLHRGLEDWARTNGGTWMRLGVVQGHARAERFWSAQGYVPLRSRQNVPMGRRAVTIQTRVKPLCGGALAEYLERVPRDRPDSTP